MQKFNTLTLVEKIKLVDEIISNSNLELVDGKNGFETVSIYENKIVFMVTQDPFEIVDMEIVDERLHVTYEVEAGRNESVYLQVDKVTNGFPEFVTRANA